MMSRGALLTGLGVVGAIILAGCSIGPGGGGGPAPTQLVRPYPAGCVDFDLDDRRCAAVVAIARHELRLDDPAATIELLSEPPPVGCGPQEDGTVIVCTRSGGHTAVIVRFDPASGPAREYQFHCGVGSQGSIACHENPIIRIATPMDAYHDIPCAGEDAIGNPTGCATPVPAIEASAQSAARPLTVPALDIPIDDDGAYSVEIGRVGIVNGVLKDARAKLSGETLPDVILLDGIRMALEPIDPAGKAFLNIYEHGWTPGVEEARVVLHFHVIQHEPGAVLPIRDVAVR
ncbi:MAG: hypothetical protein H0U52_15090 [Chloroflexi bacterium]|nr:hypothetical protein [Chloroflexota bacterium]